MLSHGLDVAAGIKLRIKQKDERCNILKDYMLTQFHIYLLSYNRFFTNLPLAVIQSQLFVSCIMSPINLKFLLLSDCTGKTEEQTDGVQHFNIAPTQV